MTPYWLFFLLPAGMAFIPIKGDKNVNSILWVIVGLLCILMIGLRYKVGGDWDNYLTYLDHARPREFSIGDTLQTAWGNATGYMLLSWIVIQLGMGIYAVNVVCAAIFTVGLMKYCRNQPMPWVALAAAVPYMVYGVAMGYTRQATALGFLLWGLSILRMGNERKFIGLLFLGSLFHQSLIVTLPIVVFVREKIHWLYYPFFVGFVVGVLPTCLIFFSIY